MGLIMLDHAHDNPGTSHLEAQVGSTRWSSETFLCLLSLDRAAMSIDAASIGSSAIPETCTNIVMHGYRYWQDGNHEGQAEEHGCRNHMLQHHQHELLQ